ncbi:uncharacterized protein LOC112495454 [Cephus cinctus]|uniref:Uncharacterized protein LOC112495454 n=1 Tax=Cephus cinctus TaxID=211228 RepID=A0AAJ7RWE3_CEPCN|nr:uncharacterized protein LOC112495454 [Cephus cinctus]
MLHLCINEIFQLEFFSERNFNIYMFDYQTIIASVDVNVEFGLNLKNDPNPNVKILELLCNTNAQALYTDGSKIANSLVGSACIFPQANLQIGKTLNANASVYTAECVALLDAIKYVKDSEYENFIIMSDSLSALQNLINSQFCIRKNYYILKTKEIYNNISLTSPNKSVKFYWVPSHFGIEGNEAADVLAKSFTNKINVDECNIPYTDFFEVFKKESVLNTLSKAVEESNTKGNIYFDYYYFTSTKPWFANKTYSRNYITSINRCRSNHYSLAASLARIQILDSPICECKEGIEDLNHIIWQCSLFDNERNLLLKKLFKLKLQLPLRIENIIDKPNSFACKFVAKFLLACKKSV